MADCKMPVSVMLAGKWKTKPCNRITVERGPYCKAHAYMAPAAEGDPDEDFPDYPSPAEREAGA